MKRFKTKKKMQIDAIIKYIVIIIITYITIKLCIYVLMNSRIATFMYSKHKVRDYLNYLSQNTINEPINLLNYESVLVQPAITNDKINPLTNPSIYIYNSHQKEEYVADNTDTNGMNADVYFASHFFKQELAKYNIDVLVEEGSITDFLVTNNMNYSYSYVASRYFVEDTLNKNPNLNLVIDLHRDATKKDISTTTIDNKSYAKIMFVVGQEYQTYEANLALSNHLNDLISAKYPELSRGVILKKGQGVNGVYNQDLGTNIILLELGCQENTMEEVTNTITLLAPILGEYLNGQAI